VVASTGPAVASTRPAVAPTSRSTALRHRAVMVLGPRRQTWDEFVLFAGALGPLPPVAPLPDRHTVLWQLAPVDAEFSAFAYGCRRLAAWYQALGPIIFKVGIAADPDHRFWNREYGYDSEREWHFMEVQGRGPANQMRKLEISLIAGLGGLPGCRNEAAGGEGVHPDRVHTCFQYMVVAPCGTGIGQQRAWAMLRDAASPTKHRSRSHMLSVIGSTRLAPRPHRPTLPPTTAAQPQLPNPLRPAQRPSSWLKRPGGMAPPTRIPRFDRKSAPH
jgi:hypothetical protein